MIVPAHPDAEHVVDHPVEPLLGQLDDDELLVGEIEKIILSGDIG